MTQSERARGSTTTEWDICTLSDISEKIMVGIASAATHAYRSKGVPLLRNQNIGAGWLDDSDVLFVDPEYERVFRNKRLRAGDLLTARTGYPGLTCVVPDAYENAQSFTTLITRPDPQAVDSNYLAAYINSSRGQQFFNQSQIGGAQKNVNAATLRGMPIPLPQLNEQHAIAGALSDVDALLAGLDRLVAKKRDLKQAAMQQLLSGRTRLPGFHDSWRETTLGAIGECVIGLTYSPENVASHGLLVLRSSNIQEGGLSFHDNVYVDMAVPDRVITRRGDILVCVRNGSRALIGKSALIDDSAVGLAFGAFMSVYRTKHWQFIAHAFQSDDVQRQIRDNIGATINQITNRDMKALRVKLPDEAEQVAISRVLSDMDAELEALATRRGKTQALKQAMMQELLTGRIRLI